MEYVAFESLAGCRGKNSNEIFNFVFVVVVGKVH